MTLTRAESSKLRSHIAMLLVNLPGAFHLYWLPERRRLAARSVISERPRPAPEGGLLVGLYLGGPGIRARDVFEDLLALLACPPSSEPAPPAGPAPSIAQPREIPPTTWQWAPTPFNCQINGRAAGAENEGREATKRLSAIGQVYLSRLGR